MTDPWIVPVLAAILLWWSVPRMFRIADTRLARLHIATISAHASVPLRRIIMETPAIESVRNPLAVLASLCDSLARETRGGAPPSEALGASIERHHPKGAHWMHLLHGDASRVRFTDRVSMALREARDGKAHDDARCLSLISSAIVDNNLIPAALDHASTVLRDSATCRDDLFVAASQARLSARMLTALPFILSVTAILISSSFRTSLTRPFVIVCLIFGLALNRVGWKWISRHISAALDEQPRDGEILTDHFCVSLRAGLTISQSCERWADVSRSGALVAVAIRNGDSLENALRPLTESADASAGGLAGVILQAMRDGLPVLSTINRLSSDAHAERRRIIDVRTRQLPTRLSIPLVVCVLPSFLFLSIAPLVLASLSTLTISLPPATS